MAGTKKVHFCSWPEYIRPRHIQITTSNFENFIGEIPLTPILAVDYNALSDHPPPISKPLRCHSDFVAIIYTFIQFPRSSPGCYYSFQKKMKEASYAYAENVAA